MPTINITFVKATNNFYVEPPLAKLTQSDQTITWNLNGGGVWRWNDDNGNVPIVFGPAGAGYSEWTGPVPQKVDADTYFVDLGQPNNGPAPVYFSWMFQVTDGTHVRSEDPDIGNEPHP